ncbi:MAG: UbiA family prenyltransferase [Planctomycetes bacterium]|nr:UbiA family prenyltransferase [Planctomycetota bacterium]
MAPSASLFRNYWELSRPDTLLPPTLGMVSGAAAAMGALGQTDAAVVRNVLLAAACSACLNAASNALNQVCDLEIDRFNKPHRPIPSQRISRNGALRFSIILYALAIAPTAWITPSGRRECLALFLLGALATWAYSLPALGRTKRFGLWANLTIALPRGCLLKVAGWSTVATVMDAEPWYIGMIFMLFLLGASTTKDFSDVAGDRESGIRTLPVQYGHRQAALKVMPSFILPWALIPLGCVIWNPWKNGQPMLRGHPVFLTALSILLTLWGAYVVHLMLKEAQTSVPGENHPSWRAMYGMLILAQVGFAICYWIPSGRAFG